MAGPPRTASRGPPVRTGRQGRRRVYREDTLMFHPTLGPTMMVRSCRLFHSRSCRQIFASLLQCRRLYGAYYAPHTRRAVHSVKFTLRSPRCAPRALREELTTGTNSTSQFDVSCTVYGQILMSDRGRRRPPTAGVTGIGARSTRTRIRRVTDFIAPRAIEPVRRAIHGVLGSMHYMAFNVCRLHGQRRALFWLVLRKWRRTAASQNVGAVLSSAPQIGINYWCKIGTAKLEGVNEVPQCGSHRRPGPSPVGPAAFEKHQLHVSVKGPPLN